MPTSNGEINYMFARTVATQAQAKRTCMYTSETLTLEVLF